MWYAQRNLLVRQNEYVASPESIRYRYYLFRYTCQFPDFQGKSFHFIQLFLLHVRSNKTLYDDVALIPLPVDYQPTVEQLPGTGTAASEGKITTMLS